ncbi:putative L [Cytorhabdovirus tiliae]|uniref:RNA-directed RNA polymerase n=1 Tax=Cytorhabdovirus sp. 'tiliae' TaxID=3004219 RepID=A0A9J7CGQ5_9RHAB|nr:putative L [Cytorhabdovirus tiliae]
MAFYDDAEDIFETRPMEGLGDFHLRSAITDINLNLLISRKGRFREQKAFNELTSTLGALKRGDIAYFMGKLFKNIGYELDDSEVIGFDIAQRTLRAEKYLFREIFGENSNLELISDLKMRGSPYESMCNFLQLALIAANAKSSGRCQHDLLLKYGRIINGIPVLMDQFKTSYYLAGDLISIKEYNKPPYLYTVDMLRMITDKCTERNNVIIGTQIGFHIMPDVYLCPDSLLSFWSRSDNLLMTYKNDAYKIFKTFEALCWGCLLTSDDSELWDKDRFLLSTINGLSEDFPRNIIENLVNDIRNICITPHHFSQLSGLFRLWGHPAVDPLQGLLKVKKIGAGEKVLINEIVEISGRKIKEIFFTNYFRRHGQYPEYSCDNENQLNEVISSSRKLNLKDPNYRLPLWDNIRVKKVFDTPETFNLSLIVADTAISPTRKEINRAKSGKEILSPHIRRGVLKFIKDGVINCKDLLESVDKYPFGLEQEYRIIGEYPKERELNPVPRMFALMTLIMRAYVVVTESMLGDILDYFPGITMVDDLLTLSKKMIANTREHHFRKSGSEWFVINIDFEKWNLNMRKDATKRVFEFLGDIFGLPTLYQKTYDIFQNSIIYLADGSYLPKIGDHLELSDLEDSRSYKGHMGGFEGLRQKGWTIFTMSLIAYVCDKEGVNYRLMGQGDNQVLMVEVFSLEEQMTGVRTTLTKADLVAQVNRIMKELIRVFDGVGLPMKPLETWVSSSLFLYGKIPIYKGVPLSMSLKRISRIFPFSNEDLMTLDNALSAISANAQSASFYDISPSVSYLCARWQQVKCIKLFLSYHPLSGEKPFKSGTPSWTVKGISGSRKFFKSESACSHNELILGLLYGFKSLGGSNGISIFHLILRGFPDPQSRDMSFLFSIFSSTRDSEIKKLISRWMRVKLSPDMEKDMLVEDPTSLNLLVPPQTLSITRKIIRENLRKSPVTSQFGGWFKELLDIPQEKERKTFISRLLSGDVIFPRLSHDLYGATLYGYSDSILSKVDKTVTLSRISLKDAKVDVVKILLIGELKFLNYLWWKMSEISHSDVDPVSIPSLYIQKIRDQGWGCRVDGVTVPFPHQIVERTLCNIFEHHPNMMETNYVTVTVNEPVKTDVFNLKNTIGFSPPYLGSSTREKLFSKHEKALFGTEPLLRRPVSLARLINWVVPEGSRYHHLIKDLISAVTDADPDSFIEQKERPGGSVAHRYHDSALTHGALSNTLFGPGTHMTMCTDFMNKYGKGQENVNLHYQALLCWIQSCTTEWLFTEEGRNNPLMTLHYHVRDNPGLTPVEDNIDDLPLNIEKELIPSRPDNPYLFVSSAQISYKRQRFTSLRLTGIPVSAETAESQFNLSWSEVLHDMLGLKMMIKIQGGSAEEDEVSGLFDIVGINRSFTDKIEVSRLYSTIYSLMYWGAFKEEREKNPEKIMLSKDIKGIVIKRLIGTDHQRFVDLCPLITDAKCKLELSQMEINITPLGFPVSPRLLTIAVKSSVISYIRTYKGEPELNIKSYLIEELASNPVAYMKLVMMSRLRSSTLNCIYCKLFLESYDFQTLDDLEGMVGGRCSSGHKISKKHLNLFKWTRIAITMDALIKLAPTTDPNIRDEVIINMPLWRKMRGIELVSNIEVRNWVREPPRVNQEFLYSWEHHSLYNVFGVHKVPTSGMARVYDSLCMARSLNYLPVLNSKSKILVLGDGFGYSSAIIKLMTNSMVIGWTYIRVDESAPHLFPHSNPPAHQILGMENMIETKCSGNLSSDILHDKWDESFKYICSTYGEMDLIFSEIELQYTADDVTSYHTYYQRLMKIGVDHMIIKTKHITPTVLGMLMGYCRCFYRFVKIVSGVTRSGGNIDMWTMVRSYKLDAKLSHLEYPSTNDMMKIVMRVNDFLHLNRPISNDELICINDINLRLMTPGLKVFYEDWVKTWFSMAGLNLWDNNLLTELWYEIKRGRRPIIVRDDTGKAVNYLFTKHDVSLFNRLMVLFLVRLRDEEYRSVCQNLMSWRMSWIVSRKIIKNTINIWTLVLHRAGWKPNLPVDIYQSDAIMDQGDVMKIAPYLRMTRDWMKYNHYEEYVTFKYIKSLHRYTGSESNARDDLYDDDNLWDESHGIGDFEEGVFMGGFDEMTVNTEVNYPYSFPISKRAGYTTYYL